jgi:hypothetical protein
VPSCAGTGRFDVKLGKGGWLVLSLALAVAYSIPGLRLTLGDELVVADDARQHVFWMQRFGDPSLFPGDLVADYYTFLAPPGYTALYRVVGEMGVAPLTFNKVLPLALVVVGAALMFTLLMDVAGIPWVAFVGSAIFSQLAWMRDDIPSGTPRAFSYSLLLALLVALMRWRAAPSVPRGALVVAIVILHALMYPSAALIALGVVMLAAVKEAVAGKGRQRALLPVIAAACLVAVIAILLRSVSAGPFGELYDTATVRAMPEFAPGGPFEYWNANPWEFWLLGSRSGLVAEVRPSIALCGAVLPLLLLRPDRFPLARQLRGLDLLAFPVVAGLVLFLTAHALFPRLYIPSRFMHYTVRAVLAPAAAVVIALVVDRIVKSASPRTRARRVALVIAFVALVLAYPLYASDYPIAAYHRTQADELHRFLRAQPVDSVVATLSTLADDIPTFAARQVLVSPHYAFPIHSAYYDRLRERATDLIAAQYTDDPERLASVLRRWSIDYWLLDTGYERVPYLKSPWLRLFQRASTAAAAFLERGGEPLTTTLSQCAVVSGGGYRLLEARCMLATIEQGAK